MQDIIKNNKKEKIFSDIPQWIWIIWICSIIFLLGYLITYAAQFDNYTGTVDDYIVTGGNQFQVETFTAQNTYCLESVDLKLARIGTNGTNTIFLKATEAGVPTGSDLISNTLDGTTLTTDTGTGEVKNIELSYQINSGTTYAIGIRFPTGNTSSDTTTWLNKDSNAYANGNMYQTTNNGTSYVDMGSLDFYFSMNGTAGTCTTPTPTPTNTPTPTPSSTPVYTYLEPHTLDGLWIFLGIFIFIITFWSIIYYFKRTP